jgi:outer membrane protein assembly factor BamA
MKKLLADLETFRVPGLGLARGLLLCFVSVVLHSAVLARSCPDTLQGTKFELLPILSYDTDSGTGIGAKAFLLNSLGWRESFDVVLFHSTKGERWYRMVFSVPDFEQRQGTVYPLAFDLTVDYDKWIAYKFFGVGNRSPYENPETYTREPLEISTTVTRGFLPHVVGQVGVRMRRSSNVNVGERLRSLAPAENSSVANSVGVLLSGRFDSRNSYVNPSSGAVAQLEFEIAPRMLWSNVKYIRTGVLIQYYTELGWLESVLACRGGMELLSTAELPVQMLSAIGGTKTVRGSVQDRFLDRTGAVVNVEWRLPLFWRFGAILGADAGKVWHDPGKIDLQRWAMNPVVGLRLYMDTFVVRADLGFGKESTGFYLNFGQLF